MDLLQLRKNCTLCSYKFHHPCKFFSLLYILKLKEWLKSHAVLFLTVEDLNPSDVWFDFNNIVNYSNTPCVFACVTYQMEL